MNINHSYGEQCDSKDWLVLYSMFVHGVKAMDLHRSMVKAPLPPVFDSLQAVVSRGGLAIRCQAGKRTDVGSILCFGHYFSSRALSRRVGALQISIIIIICGHCLTVLPLTINETLKWLTPVLILMQNQSGGDSATVDISSTPTSPPPPPTSTPPLEWFVLK